MQKKLLCRCLKLHSRYTSETPVHFSELEVSHNEPYADWKSHIINVWGQTGTEWKYSKTFEKLQLYN